MKSFLEKIIDQKIKEVEALKTKYQSNQIIQELLAGKRKRTSQKSFLKALQSKPAVIAEIKRKSPSRGLIATRSDPSQLAKLYIDGGANAISVLTDKKFFNGSLNDLKVVQKVVKNTSCPLLRKEFILDPIQIAESIDAGADAILLIVSILGKKTASLLNYANKMNIDALVEVHNLEELICALNARAKIIGVNNRDLDTFKVNINASKKLIKFIPKHIIKVSESGIMSPEAAQEIFKLGFNAILVGESLLSSKDPSTTIQEMRQIYE